MTGNRRLDRRNDEPRAAGRAPGVPAIRAPLRRRLQRLVVRPFAGRTRVNVGVAASLDTAWATRRAANVRRVAERELEMRVISENRSASRWRRQSTRQRRFWPSYLIGSAAILALAGCPNIASDPSAGENSNSDAPNNQNANVGGGSASENENGAGDAVGNGDETGSGSVGNDNSASENGNSDAGNQNQNDNAGVLNENQNDNAGGGNDNGNTNGNGNGNTNSGGDGGGADIVSSANSIAVAEGGILADPEGVAAPENVLNVTWKDARGADRTLALGGYLHRYDFSFDDGQQVVNRSANDDAYGHPGFGYVVSHNNQNGNSPIGKANVPSLNTTQVFDGGHHAYHRVELMYDRDKEGGGNGVKIPVVIEWFVATGRDHPVWSVTWKMDQVQNPNNVDFDIYRMDVRGPYGSLNFDGAASPNEGDAIGGVSWGDAGFKFATLDGQFTLNSPWAYDLVNSVCFSHAWTANTNAEMAIVQTRAADKQMGYGDRVVGRERGRTSADNFTDKGDCNGFGDNRAYSVPCVNGWPYQLMNYDWAVGSGKPPAEATGTKLIAWGSPYGWLGASRFDLFDYSGTADGRGERSYATFIVLGPKQRYDARSGQWDQPGDAVQTIRAAESLAAAAVGSVTAGSIATQAPAGPGAARMKNLANGYDDTYAAFRLSADANRVAFTLTPATALPVRRPIFIVSNFTGAKLPAIRVGGAALSLNDGTAASGAFVSLNDAADELWVTINADVSQATAISIEVAEARRR